MKRTFFFRASCLMLCLLLAGCAQPSAAGAPAPSGTGSADPDYQVYSDAERGYSFRYYKDMTAEKQGIAARVFLEGDGRSPYIDVYFTQTGEVAFDRQGYFYFKTEDLRAAYGERLLETGEVEQYTIAGKTLYGAQYLVHGEEADARRLFFADESDTYVVQYEAVCENGDESCIMDELEELVETLKPDADYYSGGASPAGGAPGTAAPHSGSSPASASAPDTLGGYAVTKAEPLRLQTALYDGGFFSLQLPAGWRIETTGEYTLFGFYAYDPAIPERQIFFYCKHEPLRKSVEAKNLYQASADMVGPNDPYGYQISADAPVLIEPTTDYFFYIYNDYNAYINKYGVNHRLPVMNDISILEKFQNTTPSAPNTLDNSIVRATFGSANGVKCEGLMAAQVTDKLTITNVYPGVDMGMYTVYNCNGVIAPIGEFDELREQLMACLASFTFTQSYVDEARRAVGDETKAILAASSAMNAAYDAYNSAWSARQSSNDILSQKNSDATLGYDRLYDPDTGEVYRAELGFYDDYDLNRSQYSNPDLQLIDGSSESYYLSGVDYYITK